jgi:hypothetical protein
LREECRLRVFDNRVLRRIFGPKRDEVRVGNGEDYLTRSSAFLIKYYCDDQVKKTEMDRTCSTYGESKGAYRALVGKPEKRRPLGRLRRRWEDNTNMDPREVDWGHGLDRSGSE